MSLSEQNRALIEREWGDKIFREGFQQKGARVYPETLDRLLDAARAEGVAALQQAGEHVAEVGNLIDLPTGPVAWARSTVIRDRDGYAIGSDEPEVHWGPTYPEDETGWLPLFALPQQTALVEQGVEKIVGQHEPAACGASAPSEPPRSDGWQDIASAPRDGTTIQARIPGHGSDNMIAWISDALDDGNGSCGAWTFVLEGQEPPSCWSDGWCWAVNEDGERSAEPTEWKPPMPEGEKP